MPRDDSLWYNLRTNCLHSYAASSKAFSRVLISSQFFFAHTPAGSNRNDDFGGDYIDVTPL